MLLLSESLSAWYEKKDSIYYFVDSVCAAVVTECSMKNKTLDRSHLFTYTKNFLELLITIAEVYDKAIEGIDKFMDESDKHIYNLKQYGVNETNENYKDVKETITDLLKTKKAVIQLRSVKLEEIHTVQFAKMKIYTKLLKEHNGFTEAFLHAHPELLEFSQQVDEQETQAEEKAAQAYADLMHEEDLLVEANNSVVKTKTAPTKKQHKHKKNQSKTSVEQTAALQSTFKPASLAKPVKTLAQQVAQLNSARSVFHLHERVARWFKAEFTAIETFTDYIEGTIVCQYAGLDQKRLKYQKNTHNVAWAQCIISGPLAEIYAFDHCYSDTQHGKALFASMHSGDETKSGLLVLGIEKEKRLIYHAQFRPFIKYDILPSHVAELLKIDSLTTMENGEETKSSSEQWKDTSLVTFSLLDKDIIEVKIKDKRAKKKASTEEAIYFHIYPLKQ